MPSIRRLDPSLVNKIAAGEVIERPASVVKELVENALDAGANRVVVEIEEGGRKLIRVSDDGCGIAADDLPLAFESHATSKIATLDDLFAVRTLGFRGEALASIAAVAHLQLTSRPRGTPAGASLEVRGGESGRPRAAGAPEGTTAEVRNLFYNVPVRRTFLRSLAVEFGHIAEAMTRFALAHPAVRFELHHDGRREFALPPADDPRSRIAHFFGEDLAKALIQAGDSGWEALPAWEGDSRLRPPEAGFGEARRSAKGAEAAAPDAGMSRDRKIAPTPGFTAWLAPPAFSRPSLKAQYVFLNGRFIRDRVLTHAIGEAYRELVMSGRHPVAFLYLSVPAAEVDVNVHPTKIEVRFRNHWRLHDRVVEAFRKALVKADLMPAVPVSGGAAPGGFDPTRVQGAIVDFFARQGGGSGLSPATSGFRGGASFPPPVGPSGNPALSPPPAPAVGGAPSPRRFQLHGSYIIEEAADGIVIIDQHALHERVNLEAIRRQWERAALPRQRLLVPAVVELSAPELARLEDARPALESFGIEWEDFGGNTIVVRTVPDLLQDADPARVVRDFLDFAADHLERPSGGAAAGREAAATGLVDEVLHFLACRASVKAGDALAPAEIEALLAERERLENAATCAHGRPVALKLTLADLERYFKRK